MTRKAKIAFIGGGNMGRSLIGGLLDDGYPANQIRVCDHDEQQLEILNSHYAVSCSTDAAAVIEGADCVVLGVKPQNLQALADAIKDDIQKQKPLIISIAAGIQEDSLQRWLGGNCAIVRCMPNTPALIQAGATGLYANALTKPAQKDLAESILRAVGLTLWLKDEALLDAVTALSGSGPAYYFYVMEAMQAAGEEIGLSAEQARLLTLQTAFGAAKMALESSEDPATLRRQVTSKGGTTERALQTLENGKLADVFTHAIHAAYARAKELAKLLDT